MRHYFRKPTKLAPHVSRWSREATQTRWALLPLYFQPFVVPPNAHLHKSRFFPYHLLNRHTLRLQNTAGLLEHVYLFTSTFISIIFFQIHFSTKVWIITKISRSCIWKDCLPKLFPPHNLDPWPILAVEAILLDSTCSTNCPINCIHLSNVSL